MGMVFGAVRFDGRAPDAAAIADGITQITGLAVKTKDLTIETADTVREMYLELTFLGFPRCPVKIYTYRPGAVKEQLEEMYEKSGVRGNPFANAVEGVNEAPGTQTVHLEAYMGQEPTLYCATMLALEALGGKPRTPIPEESRGQYGRAITPAEMRRRHRRSERNNLFVFLGIVAMLPVLIPIWIVKGTWYLIKLPGRMQKAYRFARAQIPDDVGGA